jgi:hypothetical protein
VSHYPVELSISFEGGSGVTRFISRTEVRFATAVQLAPGQPLTGTIHSPADDDGLCTTLHYSARVTGVRGPDESSTFEVEARFEQLGFGAPRDGRSGGWPSPPPGGHGPDRSAAPAGPDDVALAYTA